MSATVSITPAALKDIDRLASYIQQHNLDAAHRFLHAAEKVLHLLAKQPLLGEAFAHPKYPELRYRTLGRRFRNYVVFYQPAAEGVEIIRVLHGAQDLKSTI